MNKDLLSVVWVFLGLKRREIAEKIVSTDWKFGGFIFLLIGIMMSMGYGLESSNLWFCWYAWFLMMAGLVFLGVVLAFMIFVIIEHFCHWIRDNWVEAKNIVASRNK